MNARTAFSRWRNILPRRDCGSGCTTQNVYVVRSRSGRPSDAKGETSVPKLRESHLSAEARGRIEATWFAVDGRYFWMSDTEEQTGPVYITGFLVPDAARRY
jgi:hypothetical protein